MKNKKGFTLIELLAVIVILAIIALIATPIILNMITKARKNAARSSALGYIDAIEYNNGFAELEPTKYTAIESGEVSEISVNLKGKKPTSGTVTIDTKGKVERAELCINGYNVTYENNDATVGDKCDGSSEPSESVAEPNEFSTDSWATINNAVKTDNISNYNVGDKKIVNIDVDGDGTKEPYHLVIVNKSTPSKCSGDNFSQSACGFVLQFEESLNIINDDDKKMNLENTNVGGWPATAMRAYLNTGENSVYNKLKAEIGDIIVDTTVVSGHGRDDNNNQNFISIDKVFLASTTEVGKEVGWDSAKEDTRTFDFYVQSSDSLRKKYKYGTEVAVPWWSRTSVSNNNYYYYIRTYGDIDYTAANNEYANYNFGVVPAFRVGK